MTDFTSSSAPSTGRQPAITCAISPSTLSHDTIDEEKLFVEYQQNHEEKKMVRNKGLPSPDKPFATTTYAGYKSGTAGSKKNIRYWWDKSKQIISDFQHIILVCQMIFMVIMFIIILSWFIHLKHVFREIGDEIKTIIQTIVHAFKGGKDELKSLAEGASEGFANVLGKKIPNFGKGDKIF